MVSHSFNLNIWKSEAYCFEFEASLVYIARDAVSKKKKKKSRLL